MFNFLESLSIIMFITIINGKQNTSKVQTKKEIGNLDTKRVFFWKLVLFLFGVCETMELCKRPTIIHELKTENHTFIPPPNESLSKSSFK